MSSSGLITKTLTDSRSLTDAENSKITELIKTYPYFVPSRYAGTATDYRNNKAPASIYTAKELYVTNWLLFNEYLGIAPIEQSTGTNDASVAEQTKPIAGEHVPTYTQPIMADEESAPVADADNSGKKTLTEEEVRETNAENLIQPVYTEDYFRHQGVPVSDEIPVELDKARNEEASDPKSLMVMMSFAEWLQYFKAKKQKETEEEEEKKALRTMWQKEKLAAALEEEGDEIPEDVFKMAVDSIAKEDGLISESLAEIHYRQGRYDKAVDMYRKLSLRNPGKKVYFARKIEEILKNK